jgi:hypothetical protein
LTKGPYEFSFTLNESKIHLKSDKKEAVNAAVKEIKYHRERLVEFVREHPDFRYRLRPMTADAGAPRIIRLMTMASSRAGVGPMAAVAGALADVGLEAMLREKASVAVVEDGGEIAVYTERPVVVSVFSGNPAFMNKIGFLIEKKDCPVGIATSTSKTDHALSFGEADSVTVVAVNASLADATATAVCNSVVGGDAEESIQRGLDRAKAITGVRGVLIVRGDKSGLWGELPKIVRII